LQCHYLLTSRSYLSQEYAGSPELSSFHKGRGIGDCGAIWGWAWTGKTFRLTAYATMPECRGISSDDWITLWRARTK
jgi:hypothetical protein